MFQAVFAWATPFADALEGGVGWLIGSVIAMLPPSLLRDLLTDGVIAGVGSVIVFLPQIVILFFFILVLEASGYMVRAAFLMDRLMAYVGLSGRSFIPLLSSFACAIPGIMATRTHRRSQGPADDDPDRAADDLLGAAAGLCRDHRRLHPRPRRRLGHRPAGAGDVRALCRRHRRRDGWRRSCCGGR